MTTIEIKNVDFGYDEEHIVLHDINLDIREPGLYCVIGPNGVGKSTLAKCVSKIVNPLKGEVLLNGKNIKEMSHRQVAEVVGYVPAFSQDVFSMSVVDTIMVGRHNHRRWGSRKKDMEVVYKAMKIMRIMDLAQRKFNELSAGQHQKVSIARGLVQETEVLILDEPTANLDVKFQVYVMELLRGVAEKLGIIILTICHDLNVTAKYAHKVIMLERPGKIYAFGTPEEVLTADNIERVYGIKCRVIEEEQYRVPLVILGEPIMNDAIDGI
ncbi:ABC transporter ATP-binding protein [Methanomassiliicoccales archaeon LGM-RCC1]|jgi:iron complex transport system ATP-binding protein|nr:ABC transporter ATP-binding protein [Candidatus Methanomethylophilaceae archaeon]WII08217.1 ABC transporter ATP-binding protein [Methanomassiliicoccales archaeon LGM-RCC1]